MNLVSPNTSLSSTFVQDHLPQCHKVIGRMGMGFPTSTPRVGVGVELPNFLTSGRGKGQASRSYILQDISLYVLLFYLPSLVGDEHAQNVIIFPELKLNKPNHFNYE